jgi:ABC-2 type transport system permease protein
MMTVRAMASREVKQQLTSPVTWFVVGLFALLAGAAFVANLNAFLELSIEALSAPRSRPVNVNQLLIRPFLVHLGLAALIVLPLITARARSSEPWAAQSWGPASAGSRAIGSVVVAQFGALLAVFVVMLAMSLAPIAVLFIFGAPEWGPIISGYLGLLLMGAAFISAALFISSLATSTMPAAIATFAIALALAGAAWLARSADPAAQPAFRRLSAGEALDDFAKGVIDTGHVVTCLTIVVVALFLTRHIVPPREPAR